MHALLLLLIPTAPAEPGPKIDAVFAKVGPSAKDAGRSRGRERAVVLIHGLALHPIKGEKAGKAGLRGWQKSDSVLVKELSAHSDVYSFAYAQTSAVEKVPESTGLAGHIRGLKKLGYKEIVLVGHSAGGLVARHFVEDNPDAGVTKVIQVCTPNGGSTLAALKAAREAQIAFLSSLSRTARAMTLEKRKDVTIPPKVEFACVVGALRLGTDGVVSSTSQWSEDLQKQGVPAHLLRTTHWDAMKTARGAEFLSKLILDPQPRWKAEQVSEAKKKLLGG